MSETQMPSLIEHFEEQATQLKKQEMEKAFLVSKEFKPKEPKAAALTSQSPEMGSPLSNPQSLPERYYQPILQRPAQQLSHPMQYYDKKTNQMFTLIPQYFTIQNSPPPFVMVTYRHPSPVVYPQYIYSSVSQPTSQLNTIRPKRPTATLQSQYSSPKTDIDLLVQDELLKIQYKEIIDLEKNLEKKLKKIRSENSRLENLLSNDPNKTSTQNPLGKDIKLSINHSEIYIEIIHIELLAQELHITHKIKSDHHLRFQTLQENESKIKKLKALDNHMDNCIQKMEALDRLLVPQYQDVTFTRFNSANTQLYSQTMQNTPQDKTKPASVSAGKSYKNRFKAS